MNFVQKITDAFLRPSFAFLTAHLRPNRHDELGREQGQSILRVVLAVSLTAYLAAVSRPTVDVAAASPAWLFFCIAFIALAASVMIFTLRDNASSPARRTLMNLADVSIVSYTMIATLEAGIPLFALYFWITLGNGFRYQMKAMILSAVLSLIGFYVVIALSPVWQQYKTVSAAIALSLALLPLYSARFVRQSVASGDTKKPPAPTSDAASDAPARPPFLQRLRQHIQAIRLKRHDELGREQGQAIVRVAISTSVLIYLIFSHYPISFADGPPGWLVFLSGFIVLSFTVAVLAQRDRASSITRRTITNAADVIAISYLMISTGEAGIPLFVLYLWITLGNGFRFGLRAMLISAALSILGFGGVVSFSSIWSELTTVSIAVVIALILLPLYSAHLIHQLSKAMKRVEEANAAKSRFLARMSHELRTPLNGILGTTDLLAANKRLVAEDHALLDVVRESVRLSLRQIDNVLDFSKIEAGKLVLESTEFDMHELLNRTVRLVRGIALDKSLRLMLRIDTNLPYRLVGDPHYVQEVLLNLLSNAIKFTSKGYVSLDATLVASDAESVQVRLAVHDTGIGIEPAALGRIFEAFSQEDVSTTRRYGGTGLGTTIAKQLVELMDGRLNVSSKKAAGSTFSAEIRFRRGKEQIKDGTAESFQFPGLRLLLVSENTALRDLATAAVKDHGASLAVVGSVADALAMLGRAIRVGNPIHAVLVDTVTAFAVNGKHRAEDFLEKAWLSFTPTFLVCDVSPNETHLRQWGYAGVLSYDLPSETLQNTLHASNLYNADINRGVVRVEPWAWGRAPSSSSQPRPRLLIADDNRTNLMILRKILETANYEVETAEDGDQALEMMLDKRYKAVILDMHMPGLDGLTVIRQYRMMRRTSGLPIVMLTANATVNAKLESADAGADAYLAKPATAEEIVGTIKRLVDETEVYDISRAQQAVSTPPAEPVLNTDIITEIDRLYNDPSAVALILDEFERESARHFETLAAMVKTKNHAGFCDLLHALKGNGANVGALRFAQICHEIGACGLLDFRRDGEKMLQRLQLEYADAAKALRDFTAMGGPNGPAHGRDHS